MMYWSRTWGDWMPTTSISPRNRSGISWKKQWSTKAIRSLRITNSKSMLNYIKIKRISYCTLILRLLSSYPRSWNFKRLFPFLRIESFRRIQMFTWGFWGKLLRSMLSSYHWGLSFLLLRLGNWTSSTSWCSPTMEPSAVCPWSEESSSLKHIQRILQCFTCSPGQIDTTWMFSITTQSAIGCMKVLFASI